MGTPEKEAPEEVLREEISTRQISLTHLSSSLALAHIACSGTHIPVCSTSPLWLHYTCAQ